MPPAPSPPGAASADGSVAVLEINELDDAEYAVFDAVLPDELAGLLTNDGARSIAAALPNNYTVGLLLFENVWAARFAQAVRSAKGEAVLNERIPHAVIETLAAASGQSDLIAQLQQLAQLKQAGVLSDAEFEAAKARLLNG